MSGMKGFSKSDFDMEDPTLLCASAQGHLAQHRIWESRVKRIPTLQSSSVRHYDSEDSNFYIEIRIFLYYKELYGV